MISARLELLWADGPSESIWMAYLEDSEEECTRESHGANADEQFIYRRLFNDCPRIVEEETCQVLKLILSVAVTVVHRFCFCTSE